MVGEFMGIAQILLYKSNEQGGILECKNEWINPKFDYDSNIGSKLELQEPMLLLVEELMREEKWFFGINSNDPMQREAAIPYRRRYQTFISMPIYVKGSLYAVLDFSSEEDELEWNKSELDLASLVAGVFSGVFERDAIEHDLNVVMKLKADLTTSKEHAEYLSRSKSLFLSRMSHEMRTPMNAIMGMMQIIKKRDTPDNLKGFLETIDKEARKLLDLIDNVLNVSDMEYGFFTLAESSFDWAPMIDDVLTEARRNASVKNQTIESVIDPNIPASFVGDEMRLKQVISNFLSNSVKYTNENGTVGFKARVLNDDGVTVTLEMEVSDNGIGISREQQRILFDLFEQVDGSLTRKQGGIGIGLVLSKRIIEMMGGTINVESELDKGAKFTFTCKLFKA